MRDTAKALFALRVAALLSAVFALFGVGFAAFQIRETAVTLAADADLLTGRITDRVDALNEPTEQLRHVMLNARLAMDNLNKAAIDERLYMERELPVTIGKVEGMLDSARTAVQNAGATADAGTLALNEVTARVHEAERMEADSTSLMASSLHAVRQADALLSGPEIPQILADAEATTRSTAETMDNLNQTTAEWRRTQHGILHPAWPGRVGHWVRHLF